METTNEALRLIAQSIRLLKEIFEDCHIFDIEKADEAIKLLDNAVDKLAEGS